MFRKGTTLHTHWLGMLHSYSQIVFARHAWLGVLLLAVSFAYPSVGTAGLLATVLANALAHLLLRSTEHIKEGLLGFGPALAGMFLGSRYAINTQMLLLVAMGALLCLVLTVGIHGFLQKYKLPFLTLPFALTCWIMSSFALSVQALQVNDFFLYPQSSAAHTLLHPLDAWLGSWFTQPHLSTFFKTLGGIFFNNSLAAGILVFVGTFCYSQMGALMMAMGFTGAFLMYYLFGLPVHELTTNLAGANYIYFALAMAGFYLVGNVWALLATLLMMPVLTGFVFFFNHVLGQAGLPPFTLAFVVTAISFIWFLQWKTQFNGLILVQYQSNHHETNLYAHLNGLQRSRTTNLLRFSLPFMGEWWVSQGHTGQQTHLGAWRFALDFVITDVENRTWFSSGTQPEDYYCYNKPVLAPADGLVVRVIDHIKDNPIGQVNIENNWGNSIVIQHAPGLFSQVSHLRQQSVRVAVGQQISRGTLLGLCGNSGRSAEPHLHFQLQASPEVGAPTLDYPLAYFLDSQQQLHAFSVPQQGQTVQNTPLNPLLQKAFTLLPGQKFKLQFRRKTHYCEVFTDAWNRTYLFNHTDQSSFFFYNDGTMFYANSFYGKPSSPLHHLFMALHKVYMGYIPGLTLLDHLPINYGSSAVLKLMQNIVAPLYIFNRGRFELDYKEASRNSINLQARIDNRLGRVRTGQRRYSIEIANGNLSRVVLHRGPQTEELLCEPC